MMKAVQDTTNQDRFDALLAEFERCGDWLQAALNENVEITHTLDDVRQGCIEGRFQFWPAERGAVISEILQYPRARHFHAFLGGGELDQIMDMVADMESFARFNNCTAVTINGRAGWAKVLKDIGYQKGLMTVAKVFDNGEEIEG